MCAALPSNRLYDTMQNTVRLVARTGKSDQDQSGPAPFEDMKGYRMDLTHRNAPISRTFRIDSDLDHGDVPVILGSLIDIRKSAIQFIPD